MKWFSYDDVDKAKTDKGVYLIWHTLLSGAYTLTFNGISLARVKQWHEACNIANNHYQGRV